MKYLAQLLALASATAALAAPAEGLSKRADVQYEDTFDDLTSNVAVPQLFPVGDYHGLAYSGVVVLVCLPLPSSIDPH